MSDPTSPKAVSDLVLLSRCRAAEALGLNLSPSEVMALAALAAERDRLAAENARLREALGTIVDSYEASSELHTSSADCAANLYDRARAALDLTPDPRVAALVEENARLREYYRASEAMCAVEHEWRQRKAGVGGILDGPNILSLTDKLTKAETWFYRARAALKGDSHE